MRPVKKPGDSSCTEPHSRTCRNFGSCFGSESLVEMMGQRIVAVVVGVVVGRIEAAVDTQKKTLGLGNY